MIDRKRVHDLAMAGNPTDGRGVGKDRDGTLADTVDAAIKAVRAAVASGDRAAIFEALAGLQRLGEKHERIWKNRVEDRRGRSRGAMLNYVVRSRAILDAAAAAIAARGGPDSADSVAELGRQSAILAEEIRRLENGGGRGSCP